jgi:hypothetical protein
MRLGIVHLRLDPLQFNGVRRPAFFASNHLKGATEHPDNATHALGLAAHQLVQPTNGIDALSG